MVGRSRLSCDVLYGVFDHVDLFYCNPFDRFYSVLSYVLRDLGWRGGVVSLV